jgi:hypothetical protein
MTWLKYHFTRYLTLFAKRVKWSLGGINRRDQPLIGSAPATSSTCALSLLLGESQRPNKRSGVFELDPQLGSGRMGVTLKGLPGWRDASALKPGDKRSRGFHAFGHFLLRQARFHVSSKERLYHSSGDTMLQFVSTGTYLLSPNRTRTR